MCHLLHCSCAAQVVHWGQSKGGGVLAKNPEWKWNISPEALERLRTDIPKERRSIRENLLDILSDPAIQNEMCIALVREAIEGNGSGTVRSAFETVRSCIGEEREESGGWDMSLWSDEALRRIAEEGEP